MGSMYSKFDISKEEFSVDQKDDEFTWTTSSVRNGYQAKDSNFTIGEPTESKRPNGDTVTTTVTREGNTLKWDVSTGGKHIASLSDDKNTLTFTLNMGSNTATIAYA